MDLTKLDFYTINDVCDSLTNKLIEAIKKNPKLNPKETLSEIRQIQNFSLLITSLGSDKQLYKNAYKVLQVENSILKEEIEKLNKIINYLK